MGIYIFITLPLPAFAVQDCAKVLSSVDFEVYVSFPSSINYQVSYRSFGLEQTFPA